MKKLILLAATLAILLISAAALALAQAEPGDEIRCLIPEGCGPVFEDELLCLIPEGCDIDGDGVPDLEAGEPVPAVGTVQYDNTA